MKEDVWWSFISWELWYWPKEVGLSLLQSSQKWGREGSEVGDRRTIMTIKWGV